MINPTAWARRPRVRNLASIVVMLQVFALVQGCTGSTQRREEIAKSHENRAAALTGEAIEHAKLGDTEAFS